MRLSGMKGLATLAAFAVGSYAAPATAQTPQTWVSPSGDDGNSCVNADKPCKTFFFAMNKTAPGGEILVAASGSFGNITITKSITIRAVGAEATIIGFASGITIDAGRDDRVVLQGLNIVPSPIASKQASGIIILGARNVVILDSTIRQFKSAAIDVNSSTKTRVEIQNVRIIGNETGVRVQSPNGASTVRIDDSLIDSSNTAGISTTGAGNTVSVSSSRIYNAKAFDIGAGPIVQSYGDNIFKAGGDKPILVPKG